MGAGVAQRKGYLARKSYPTQETSNFGPIPKFLLDAPSSFPLPLAEPGMSGGPVINDFGQVIGLSTEKPFDPQKNSVVGLDLTHPIPLFVSTTNCKIEFDLLRDY